MLLLAVPPAKIAVLAGRAPGDDATEALDAVPLLARELEVRGAGVATGPLLWAALGRETRETGGDLPVGVEQLLAEAHRDFDEGRFAEAVRLAGDAAGRLERVARSVAVEASERGAQVLWGLSALADGLEAEARSHLQWALVREPAFVADPSRFAPPLRRQIEAARAGLAGWPRGSLAVGGTPGASIYVDGLLSGQVPATLNGLLRRPAWVWLERAGRRSLAHRVELGASKSSVAIDLELEAGLGQGPDGAPLLTAPAGDPQLLARLAVAFGAPAVAVLSRCAGAGCWQLEATVAGQALSLRREVGVAALPPLEDLARELLAEASPAPSLPVAATATPPATEPAAAAPPPARAWPWIVAGVAVAAVGAGVGLYFALRSSPSNDLGLYSSTGSP